MRLAHWLRCARHEWLARHHRYSQKHRLARSSRSSRLCRLAPQTRCSPERRLTLHTNGSLTLSGSLDIRGTLMSVGSLPANETFHAVRLRSRMSIQIRTRRLALSHRSTQRSWLAPSSRYTRVGRLARPDRCAQQLRQLRFVRASRCPHAARLAPFLGSLVAVARSPCSAPSNSNGSLSSVRCSPIHRHALTLRSPPVFRLALRIRSLYVPGSLVYDDTSPTSRLAQERRYSRGLRLAHGLWYTPRCRLARRLMALSHTSARSPTLRLAHITRNSRCPRLAHV